MKERRQSSLLVVLLLLLLPLSLSVHAKDLGELSANPFNPETTANSSRC